jgi:hypothetical protein
MRRNRTGRRWVARLSPLIGDLLNQLFIIRDPGGWYKRKKTRGANEFLVT